MNWNISAWSIRNPVPPILLFAVLVILGITSFMTLPITRFPNIDVPVVAVTITESGTAPAELETQVTRLVEDAIAGVPGLKRVTSTITDGASTTAAEFRLEVDTDRALNDVKDAIAKIRGDLPRTIDEPIVQRIEVENQSIVTYAATSPGLTPEQLSWFVDDVVVREIQGLRGVGRVERMGGVEREIQVLLDPDRLAALGVTAATINAQIRATNVDLSGGRGEFGGQEQAIRTLASARSIEDLGSTMIFLPGGRQVRLAELGDVLDTVKEPRSFARLDGQPVVAFSIYRAKGASDATVALAVEEAVTALAAAHPDVSFSNIDSSVDYTLGNFDSAMETLAEGAFLAVVVVLLFLRDWRATAVAAVTLPLAAIPTFFAMDLMGFSLNLVSLLAITLVTGILVDDAIVEIENIERHMAMGKTPYRAAVEASDEIGLAVMAITATIIAVFAPVSFMGGVAGQYFKQFGLTVAMAVFFSLLVARLITPMLAAYFFRPHRHTGPGFWSLLRARLRILGPLAIFAALIVLAIGTVPEVNEAAGGALPRIEAALAWNIAIGIVLAAIGFAVLFAYIDQPHDESPRDGLIMRGYTRLLRFTLRWRFLTLLTGIGLFAFAIYSVQFLPTGFIPKEDASRIVVSLELPPGATLEDTRRATDTAAQSLRDLTEVRSVLVIGGSSPTGTLEVRRAMLAINLLPKAERERSQMLVEPLIAERLGAIPDIRSFFVNERGEREFSIGILGQDGTAVAEAAARLESEMRAEAIFTNPSAMASFARPELVVRPRLDEAADLAVAPSVISETVRVATIGDADPNLARFNLGTRQVPIRVQLAEAARQDLSAIRALQVPIGSGASVPLEAVAEIAFGQGPSTIERYDRERLVKVGTGMAPGHEIGEASAFVTASDAVRDLPAGVRLQEVGDAEIQAEVFAGFAQAMGAGIMLVLVVLILLFGSVFLPITILAALPLSAGGVVGALFLTQTAISMPVVIGILMLMGIVTKNSIMLVDFAVEEERAGVPQREAIVDAGRKRARPIVMTTLAMAAGMVPAAMATGDGGEFRAPMAIAVIGGLLVSTVLSLVLIPSIYTLMDDLGRLTGRLFQRVASPNRPDERGPDEAYGKAGELHAFPRRPGGDGHDMATAAE